MPRTRRSSSKFRAKTGAYPIYPTYHMVQALYGLKAGYESAIKANGGNWPSNEQVAEAIRKLEFKGFGRPVKMREDGQGLEAQMLGVTKKVPQYPFAVMDNMMIIPAELITTPVGEKSPAWVKTIKPAVLQSEQLKTYVFKYARRGRGRRPRPSSRLMNPQLFALAILDGVSYAALLFLVALGLTLIFGVMRILNIAHGSLYAVGGYMAATFGIAIAKYGAPSWLSLPALFAAALVVGVVLGTMHGDRAAAPHPRQGSDPAAAGHLRGVHDHRGPAAPGLGRAAVLRLGGRRTSSARRTWPASPTRATSCIVLPLVALGAFFTLRWFLGRTALGRQITAVTHHREVATAMGVNARRVSLLTFVIGAALGALGGALASPTTSLVPGVGAEMMVLSFAVVATAGLGQIGGAMIAALMIGLARSFAVYLAPELEVLVPYFIMVVVLLVRPQGLFASRRNAAHLKR